MSKRTVFYYLMITIGLIGFAVYAPSIERAIKAPYEPTCTGMTYTLSCRVDQGDYLLHDEHGYMCRKALKSEINCSSPTIQNDYWYKPRCDQYFEYITTHQITDGMNNQKMELV